MVSHALIKAFASKFYLGRWILTVNVVNAKISWGMFVCLLRYVQKMIQPLYRCSWKFCQVFHLKHEASLIIVIPTMDFHQILANHRELIKYVMRHDVSVLKDFLKPELFLGAKPRPTRENYSKFGLSQYWGPLIDGYMDLSQMLHPHYPTASLLGYFISQ